MTDITWQSDISSEGGIHRDQGYSSKSQNDFWKDPRVLVSAVISILALSITLATISTCVRRSKYIKPYKAFILFLLFGG